MKQLSTLPENGVLNRIQMLTALGVCQRLKMANPLIAVEDKNLITLSIAGFAYCLSKEEGEQTFHFRSLRGNRSEKSPTPRTRRSQPERTPAHDHAPHHTA